MPKTTRARRDFRFGFQVCTFGGHIFVAATRVAGGGSGATSRFH